MNAFRSIVMLFVGIVALIVLGVFIHFLLQVALLAALVAFAYYWFTRATSARRNRERPWR